MQTRTYKHVSYLWDEATAAALAGDEVGLLVYRSNLLGADLRLTNYGGGNTSCKVVVNDPLTGLPVEVMYVKGSGGDLGTMKRSGLAALYINRLQTLKNVYRGLEYEDEMVELFNHCIYDLASKVPSIDTPLHAFLPFAYIDHLHPDAAIAIAAAKDGQRITEELFGGKIGWVGWQRPGFDLGLQLEQCWKENPGIRGIVLGSHGLFTWGDTAYESYVNTLEVIERCAEYLEENYGKKRPVFGGQKIKPLVKAERLEKAAGLAPVLRGLCSSKTKMIGHFTDDERVLEFIGSNDLERLAAMGTSCPDHFLRTKIAPLVLKEGDDIPAKFAAYRQLYADYYNSCKHADSPTMRDPNPVVILYPGVGMFTFAKDKQTARVAAEFYLNAINVMKGAEAKLQRQPRPKSLGGRVALVTGSAGGIGKAIAKRLADEGACVVINDNDAGRLESAKAEFHKQYGKDVFASVLLDVTGAGTIRQALDEACLYFGGVDIIVNCAGISISKPLEEHTEKDWDLVYDILVKGQFLVTQKGVEIMRKQGFGGDIVNIVSKNALVSGPNNAAYRSAKAAQLHLSRLNAAELGTDKIRVNVVNPDAVIADSKIWEGAWAEGRAKAYGVSVAELPAYYAKRTLLNEVILPEDIASACFVLVGGLLNKSTGNVLNVDGGVAMAFVR